MQDHDDVDTREAGALGVGQTDRPVASMNRALLNLYGSTGTPSAGAAKPTDSAAAPAPSSSLAAGVEGVTLADQEMGDATTAAPTAAAAVAGVTPAAGSRPPPRSGGTGPQTKRQRTGSRRAAPSSSAAAAPLPVTYADLGGMDAVFGDVRELIEYPLKHPEVYGWLGVDPPRGVLLHGPPGCGKTALANAIANECGVPFLRVSAPEVVSGMSGESEAKIRQLFQEAAAIAPCIVFIDEIDAIAPKRENAQREMERRIVAQMLTCLDDLSGLGAAAHDVTTAAEGSDDGTGALVFPPSKHVVVIGATNRPDSIDPALRRAGRFDREIAMGIPSEASREAILRVLSRRLRLSGDFDFKAVARRTPGFVGADLAALMKEAAALAVKRIFEELDRVVAQQAEVANNNSTAVYNAMENGANATATAAEMLVAPPPPPPPATTSGLIAEEVPSTGNPHGLETVILPPGRLGRGTLTRQELASLAITMSDFEGAVAKVQPSVRREGFTTTPDVTWDDVGSLADIREELAFAITKPIAQPELFEAMGLRGSTGVLLFGPPGCGKTLVAKAAANESGANFISIKGPELLNKYVGESERAVRQVFSRARAASPCVLFFDEMDALAPRRGADSANASAERVVNQLLTEMDGMEGRQGVYLVAATNRPDMIDPALLRPGRLDKILYVPLPPPHGRASILRALVRRTPLAADVDIDSVATSEALTGFSGADMAALLREACVEALKEAMAGGSKTGASEVAARHFAAALRQVQPSVSRKDQRMYDALRHKLRSSRGHLRREEEPAVGDPMDEEAGQGVEVPA